MELEAAQWTERITRIRPVVKNIFYKGNIDLLFDKKPMLAVVGSRRMTEYGRRIIEKWMSVLVDRGVVIVSGFMYGVDQAAHKACIENGGKTIAVLGYGIDRERVSMDEKLYQSVLENDGLILSEYPGTTSSEIWTFPARNRIVAGIADAVWVVEGAVDSGSMITAKIGVKRGIPVLALPGQVGMSVAAGVNQLIKSGKAVMTTEVGDVLDAMGMNRKQLKLIEAQESDPLLIALGDESRTADELAAILRIPIEQLVRELSMYCLRGEVEECDGKYRRRDN